MLIFTAAALGMSGGTSRFEDWPGPKIMLVEPRHGMSKSEIKDLCDTFFVLEYLTPPASALDTIGDVVSLPALQKMQPEWPLLYLDRLPDETQISDSLKANDANAHVVRSELSGAGKLETLLLGEMIVGSPLLKEFIGFAQERRVDDTTLVDLLEQTFARKYA